MKNMEPAFPRHLEQVYRSEAHDAVDLWTKNSLFFGGKRIDGIMKDSAVSNTIKENKNTKKIKDWFSKIHCKS
jgi:hypothetical protein